MKILIHSLHCINMLDKARFGLKNAIKIDNKNGTLFPWDQHSGPGKSSVGFGIPQTETVWKKKCVHSIYLSCDGLKLRPFYRSQASDLIRANLPTKMLTMVLNCKYLNIIIVLGAKHLYLNVKRVSNFIFFRKMEIICAGYPKTASKSCSAALRILGQGCKYWAKLRKPGQLIRV